MIKQYFDTLDNYTRTYGKKTLLLWQCGSFFEVYGYKDPTTNKLSGSQIGDFSRICDMSIATKKKCVNQKNIVMAGFSPIQRLDKYLPKLNNEGYTVAVWIQDEVTPQIRNELGIFSPGTYFNLNDNVASNNIMCIWIEKHGKTMLNKQPSIICGMAVINNLTGKSNVFEFTEVFFHNPTTFNEIERFYSIYSPNEVIMIHSGYDKIKEVIQFAYIDSPALHIISLDDEKDPRTKQAKNCEKQIYQQKLLETFYNTNDYDSFYESLQFKEYPIATQAFCYLLDFVHIHNASLVEKIAEPVFDNTNNTLLLANHSLKQLNILPNDSNKRLSSVVQFVNQCKTVMGRREFMYKLLHPTTDVEYLEKEYDIVDYTKKNYEKYEFIRKKFIHMKDLEKIYRKIVLNKLPPCELAQLFHDINLIQQIHEQIKDDVPLLSYVNINITPICAKITNFITSQINIERSSSLHSLETNIFLRGQYHELDVLEKSHIDKLDQLMAIKQYLSSIIQTKERKCTEAVKIHSTEKSGLSLIATKRRTKILKEKLTKGSLLIPFTLTYNNTKTSTPFDPSLLTFTKSIASNMRFSSPILRELYTGIEHTKTLLRVKLREIYKLFLSSLLTFHKEMESIIKYVTILDIITTKAYVSKKFNYCKPIIDNGRDKAFLNATKMRHVLIEQFQNNEIYVPNDISLGEKENGILLYGTNAVGKSCLIRSIGISIILAQSGMFVPCESFTYKPYTSIFTRILGNDNIFKGLSTFAVEMSELRTILRLSDENSLILGDELCSGTETNSAISIFVSGLIHLHNNKSSFIFATHFHEIVKMKEVMELDKCITKHMVVQYDKEQDLLIYDRKLKDGPGNSMYGLEVCKSLNLPQEFLERAYAIRNTNSIINNTTSRYNANKIRGDCEICNSKGEDIHHLQYQESANDDGFIDTFHKNNVANLINICKECHKHIHDYKLTYLKKKTSKGIKLVKQNNISR